MIIDLLIEESEKMKLIYKEFVLELCPSRDVNKQYYFVISYSNVKLSHFIRYDVDDAKKLFIQYVDSYLKEQVDKLISSLLEISAELERINHLTSDVYVSESI